MKTDLFFLKSTTIVAVFLVINVLDVRNQDASAVMQEAFETNNHRLVVSLQNRLNSSPLHVTPSLESSLFPKSYPLIRLLCQEGTGRLLNLKEDDFEKILMFKTEVEKHPDVLAFYARDSASIPKPLTEVDQGLFEELTSLLSGKQKRVLRTQLVYRDLSHSGLASWLKRSEIFEEKKVNAIGEFLRDEAKNSIEEFEAINQEFQKKLLSVFKNEKKEFVVETLGMESGGKWLPKDPFLVLVLVASESKKPKAQKLNSLFDILECSEFVYQIDLSGDISEVANRNTSASSTLMGIISSDSYGGVTATSAQIKQIFGVKLLPDEMAIEIQERISKLRVKAAVEGYKSIEKEIFKIKAQMEQAIIERVSNQLLRHQNEYLNEIAFRRLVAVRGTFFALCSIDIDGFRVSKSEQEELEQIEEEFKNQVTDFHQEFAKRVWKKLIRRFPELPKAIADKYPDFKFEDIKYPSLLFRSP